MRDRDSVILQKIIQYADDISETIARFALTYDRFRNDRVAKNAVSMCVLQIGELAGKLTDTFKAKHSEMPWRDITAIRNRAAHAYESVDMEILWNIAAQNIPELKSYCERILENAQ
jgi:uncharacterized protein with HEPN domain